MMLLFQNSIDSIHFLHKSRNTHISAMKKKNEIEKFLLWNYADDFGDDLAYLNN